MMTTTSTATGRTTADRATTADAATGRRRRLPMGIVVGISMVTGLVIALVLVLVAFAGAGEAVITGAALLGFASGWVLLAVLTGQLTDQPQRWPAVPAAVMAATGAGLLAFAPGDGVLTAAGWVWPPGALALAIWMVRAVRRGMTGRARWLLYPVIGVVAVTAVGGIVESVALSRDEGRHPMPGAMYDVGGHRLHLNCAGTGGPTVVLENGLGETSPLWSGITAQVARTTRVCAYDRVGQGWSDAAARPQDGLAAAADLQTLLAHAGESGPYILVGHSTGGAFAMTYAALHPAEVAGMVLLDSASPHQFTALPDYPRTYSVMRRLLPVLPALARLGALQLAPPSASTALTPSAAAQVRSFATSPRGASSMRDEVSRLHDTFAQAEALTTFDSKPLAVVTSGENANGMTGWAAAQDELAALSTNSTHWTAETSHVGLLDDAAGSPDSIRAIDAVVAAVRTGSPLASRRARLGTRTPR